MSMSEISNYLNVSNGQVDYWMKRHNIKTRNISSAIYLKHNRYGDPFKIPKFVRSKILISNNVFLYGLGLGLYWGEGTKKSLDSVRLGNSDPRLIRSFIKFLINIFDIDQNKLKFGLQIFSDMNGKKALNFWSKAININKKQFYKPLVTKSGKVGNYRYKSKYGVLTLYFNNKKLRNFLFEKISAL